MLLPRWMQGTLLATAAMNLFGAVLLSSLGGLRAVFGLPDAGHPLYRMIVAAFVLLFGFAYLWAGGTRRADPLFLLVAAAGKLSFFGILVWFWSVGELPGRAPLAATTDLAFAILFLMWLRKRRATGSS